MKMLSSPLSSPQRNNGKGLFKVDMFAKAAAPRSLAARSSTHPFVVVANGGAGRGGSGCHVYAAQEQDAFFQRIQTLDVLAKDGGIFWIDVDLSELSADRYEDLCTLLHLHEVTERDCLFEDKSVTDTKVSMFNNYQFLIVDTLLTADAKNLYTEWETRNLNIITYKCACVTLRPCTRSSSILHRVQDYHSGRLPSANGFNTLHFGRVTAEN